MPSTLENIRVSGAMLLRGGLLLSPIIAAYQGRALIPLPSPSAQTQGALAVLAATGLPMLVEATPMVLGLRPRPASPLFVPVTTFVMIADIASWAGALALVRQGRTGRGGWLLNTMGSLGLTSAVLLGIGSVIRKFRKADAMHPELGFADKVEWELLAIELARIIGCGTLLVRKRWDAEL